MLRYRVVRREGGFEPQMLYTRGMRDGRTWFPLNSQGYWLEPEAFSYGVVTRHAPLTSREDADRAIERAKLINSDQSITNIYR